MSDYTQSLGFLLLPGVLFLLISIYLFKQYVFPTYNHLFLVILARLFGSKSSIKNKIGLTIRYILNLLRCKDYFNFF